MSRPNIVFFFTDDQRFDTIRALGNTAIQTPAMDQLVAEGTTFTRAHIPGGTSGAVCMPSRAMLHTGRTLFHIHKQGQDVSPEHVLLGEHLRANGYHTFGTGKWHNGASAYARSFSHGAEILFGGMGDHWNVPAYDFDPTGAYDTTTPYCPDAFHSNEVIYRNCDHVHAGYHSSELFCDAAIDFLEDHDSSDPFFLYISFMAPHDPRTMPREFLDMYDPDHIELPPNFLGGHPFDNGDLHLRDEMLAAFPRDPREIRRHIAEYYGMISHLDAQIGRVIDTLKEDGRYDSTIFVFAGDNGLALGQHGLMGKQSLYDHSVRVPLIFAGPGVPKGERRDTFAYLLDIFPTLCDLCGLQLPESVEGQSLVPSIRDAAIPARDSLYLAYTNVQRGVRDERYKLIDYHVNGVATTQLFDLDQDPWEVHDLSRLPEHASTIARLREKMTAFRDRWDDRATPLGASFWDGKPL